MAIIHAERQFRGAYTLLQADLGEIIPIEGDIQRAQGRVRQPLIAQLLRDPDATGMDADNGGVGSLGAVQPGGQFLSHALQQWADVRQCSHSFSFWPASQVSSNRAAARLSAGLSR